MQSHAGLAVKTPHGAGRPAGHAKRGERAPTSLIRESGMITASVSAPALAKSRGHGRFAAVSFLWLSPIRVCMRACVRKNDRGVRQPQ